MASSDSDPKDLKISIVDTAKAEDGGDEIIVTVRLKNTGNRAIHYISDLRARRYDPATKKLTLMLSDEGREVIPGAVAKLPKFRFVEPDTQAEIEIRIPDRIIKLSRNVPPGQLAFEKQELADVEQVVVEVAWADVPYYKDTRERDLEDLRLPASQWQQNKARATKRLTSRSKSTE